MAPRDLATMAIGVAGLVLGNRQPLMENATPPRIGPEVGPEVNPEIQRPASSQGNLQRDLQRERQTGPKIALKQQQRHLLLLTAAVSSGCGLAAELLLGTLTSYLVGAQALAYGVAVGGFLAAMGLGAYLSRFVASPQPLRTADRPASQSALSPAFSPAPPPALPPALPSDAVQQAQLIRSFFTIEILLAPLIALVPLGLFLLFILNGPVWIGLTFSTLLLGILSGMEVPLLTRLIELDAQDLSNSLAGVLALDYVGALAGSLLFPAVLLPWVGLLPSAFLIGSLPAWMVFFLARAFPKMKSWRYAGLGIAIALWAITPAVLPFSANLENKLYKAPVVWRSQSTYQRIVLTRYGQDVRLFLNGELQLSTVDEYRYHEALVHPAMAAATQSGSAPKQVLLLGAGDGMALREVLKWPSVEQVTLVELDPAVIELAQTQTALLKFNQNALSDPRVTIQYGDAFKAVPQLETLFDVIIADFPDPDEVAIAKLYSKGFYQQLRSRLAPDGILVTQASSPFFAPKVIACITKTLNATGLIAAPYSISVPSFGPWGFVIAASTPLSFANAELPVETQFLTPQLLPTLFVLAKDVTDQTVKINQLSDPVIVPYQSNPRWSVY
ncbi:MAG: polyamine aminopropyltransferase [Phormidesmis sp.]